MDFARHIFIVAELTLLIIRIVARQIFIVGVFARKIFIVGVFARHIFIVGVFARQIFIVWCAVLIIMMKTSNSRRIRITDTAGVGRFRLGR